MYQSSRNFSPQDVKFRNRRLLRIVNKPFQWKYTSIALGMMSLGLFALLAPTYYFLYENYALLVGLAYKSAPNIVVHLERELQVLFITSMATSLFILAVTFVVAIRFTARVINPLMVLGAGEGERV